MVSPSPDRQECARRRRRGTAAVEMAFVTPLIVTLLLGTWEMGRYVEVQQIISDAAREGGRQASSGQMTNSQIITAVTNYVSFAGLPTADLVVTVNDLTNPGTDASLATALDQLQVTVSLPFKDVRWTPLKLVTTDSTNVTATVVWYSSIPLSYPNNVTSPVGN
jgi:Flp pilus assembly protein TadG